MSTDLPPEAYTKETLHKAFNWLQEQPEAVQKSVHTPERLVSLYRKAVRLQDNDAPVSSQKFISDLKNLASHLNQFGESAPLMKPQAPSEAKVTLASLEHYSHQAEPIVPEITEDRQDVESTETETKRASFEITTQKTKTKGSVALDVHTLEKVRAVQKRFNLGSENEALRLLVALGFEKFSQFP